MRSAITRLLVVGLLRNCGDAGQFPGDLSRRLNDFYLKANRVKSGTKNYGEVTALLIGYYLKSPPAPSVNTMPAQSTQ